MLSPAPAKYSRLPPNDPWLAALALEHRMPVLTHDEHVENPLEVAQAEWSVPSRASGRFC